MSLLLRPPFFKHFSFYASNVSLEKSFELFLQTTVKLYKILTNR